MAGFAAVLPNIFVYLAAMGIGVTIQACCGRVMELHGFVGQSMINFFVTGNTRHGQMAALQPEIKLIVLFNRERCRRESLDRMTFFALPDKFALVKLTAMIIRVAINTFPVALNFKRLAGQMTTFAFHSNMLTSQRISRTIMIELLAIHSFSARGRMTRFTLLPKLIVVFITMTIGAGSKFNAFIVGK